MLETSMSMLHATRFAQKSYISHNNVMLKKTSNFFCTQPDIKWSEHILVCFTLFELKSDREILANHFLLSVVKSYLDLFFGLHLI